MDLSVTSNEATISVNQPYIRGSVSATDAGGLGSFTYNSSSGAFTYTGPSNGAIRGLLSVATTTNLGSSLTYDNTLGQYSYTAPTTSAVRSLFSGSSGITYNSSTGNISVSSITFGMLAGSAVQISGESFSDSDSVLMTSAAIQDKIQSFNYSTTTGTVTSVAVTTAAGLDGAGTITSSGTIALSLDLSELTDMTAAVTGSVDELILLDNGADRRKRFAEIGLSAFSNDSGFTSNTGDITRVNAIAGDGLTGDSDTTSGIAQFTFDVGAGSGISVGSNSVAVDSTVMRNLSLIHI